MESRTFTFVTFYRIDAILTPNLTFRGFEVSFFELAGEICYPVFFINKERSIIEVSEGEIQTIIMDHHSLVAAVCQDLKIAERINRRLPPDSRKKVSSGIATVAMIINGLGFTNRTSYLAHRFFESKPIEKLLGVNFKAQDITDETLGHALDEIAKYGLSKLFAEVAFEIAIENNLLGLTNHIDTTSLLVHESMQSKMILRL